LKTINDLFVDDSTLKRNIIMKKIILLLETSREFGRQLITGIAHYSKLNGPWSFYKEPTDLKSSIPKLAKWEPDGIIMRDSLTSKELLKLKIPTIIVVHSSSYPQDLPFIKTDSKSISKLASQHFIEKGFKNLAFCGFSNYKWSKGRELFFNKFNSESGLITYNYVSPKNIGNNWENEQPYIIKWIQELPKPVGIFACNDDRGQHILEVCKFINIKVPEEVAVIGSDNDPMICELSDPPLTSIALNVESAGFETAKLLDQLIDKKRITKKEILVTPSHIVQRQSSNILAIEDPEVLHAIQYIKNNAKNKILVKDVVDITGVKRRTLEKRFRKSIHRSIYDEIRLVRVELITKLLLETNLSITKITTFFDFTDGDHISRYFKKEKGAGLREFRKLHKQF
jgi:LacI family transcriptional regulator